MTATIDMTAVTATSTSVRAIPLELERRYDQLCDLMSEPTPGVVFTMDEVGDFVRITGDPNIIHTDAIPHPVLPGLQILSSLGRFLDSEPPIFISGYQTVLSRITADFKRLVQIGAPLSLQYQPTRLYANDLGPCVENDFWVRRTGTEHLIVEGTITFNFVLDRVFNLLVRRAQR